jgi:hypothetical protein
MSMTTDTEGYHYQCHHHHHHHPHQSYNDIEIDPWIFFGFGEMVTSFERHI